MIWFSFHWSFWSQSYHLFSKYCKCSSLSWTLPGFGNAVVCRSIWAQCTITSLCCNWMTRSLSSFLCQEHLGNFHMKEKRLTTNPSSSFVDFWWHHNLVLWCYFFLLFNEYYWDSLKNHDLHRQNTRVGQSAHLIEHWCLLGGLCFCFYSWLVWKPINWLNYCLVPKIKRFKG